MTTEEYLSTIDALLAQPFPEMNFVDVTGCGGPEHHMRVLRVSRDFWDDDDGQAWAEADLRACLDALAAGLTMRWGDPLIVNLGPYLSAGCEGVVVPEPLDLLSQLAVSMQVWSLRDCDRWLALTIGQADKELPLELLAAVGRASALNLNLGGRS